MENKNRLMGCPHCNTRQFILFNNTDKKFIKHKCIEYKCRKIFYIPIKYKLIYFFLSEFDCKYKYINHVKDFFSGVLNFIDVSKNSENSINEYDILVIFINQFTSDIIKILHDVCHKKIPIYVINSNRVYLDDPRLKCIVDGLYTDIYKCYQYIIDLSVKEYNLKKKNEENI